MPADYAAVVGAFLLAYWIRPFTDLIPGVQFQFGPELLPPFGEYMILALANGLVVFALFALNRMYSLKASHGLAREFFRVFYWVTTWVMFLIAYYFLIVHQLFFSRIALAHIWIFSIFFIMVGRLLISAVQSVFLRFGIGQRRVMFVGVNALTDRFYDYIRNDRSYVVIGALADHLVSRKMELVKVVGTFDQLEPMVDKYRIDEIIQTEPHLGDKAAEDLHTFCRNRHIGYRFIPDLVRLQRSNVEVEMVGELPLVSLKETPLDGWGRVFKRIFDILFSAVVIFLLIPVWILVPIAILINSWGPVIYKSRRLYRDKAFNVYKFRSMVPNADALKKELIAKNERGDGPMFKLKEDPRITRVGRFLRKYCIDELPQLFNVLFGTMSLVGPRPHLPEEIEKYQRHHYQVFAVKPGVTGLAQVSGRSDLNFEDEVRLDVYYIENWSLWLDLKIILKTIAVVLRGNGV